MRIRPLLMTLLCAAFLLPAASHAATEVYAGAEYFRWKDPDLDLTLQGPVWLVGVASRIRPPQSILSVELRAEGFAGNVEDDDEAADTDVIGLKLQGDLGLAARVEQGVVFEPFAGLGVRWWEFEELDERWRSSYGRIGLRVKMSSRETPVQTTFEAGARIPLGSRVRTEDGSFDPDEDVAPFAEIGIRSDILKFTAFYEGLRFSNPADIDNDIFGVRLGLVLR